MNNEFECLKNYYCTDDPAAQRDRAVRAALIILNTAVSSNQGLIHSVGDTEEKVISDLADNIQSALKMDT